MEDMTQVSFGINYVSRPDTDLDSMTAPLLPRIGDHIRTPNGTTYEVVKVLFDKINPGMKCPMEITVQPLD